LACAGLAAATELPASFKQSALAMGASVATDGSLTIGTMRFVPFFSPQYDPANALANSTIGDCTLNPDSVSYMCPGGIQFAPLQSIAGQMPQLAVGFMPLAGYTLPADFSPPAGFVCPAGMNLPAGVAVMPLMPADMIDDMVEAGVIPRGAVVFNADGTVTATLNGVTSTFTPTFVPEQGQRGRLMAGMMNGIAVGADGTVVFPDGTVYARNTMPMMGMMR
jgi:hypothetical protein